MKMQRHERNRFWDLPVHCGFCGQLVVGFSGDGSVLKPCTHTLFIATDEGYEYVSERAILQLRNKGFTVATEVDGRIEVTSADEDADDSPEAITDQLDFEDALKVACYEPMPSGHGAYVGFAPEESKGTGV